MKVIPFVDLDTTIVIQPNLVKNIGSELSNAVIIPNPSEVHAILSFTSATNNLLKITICDISGKLIHWQTVPVETGRNNLVLPEKEIKPGFYFVTLTGNDRKHVVKWIKY